MKYFLFALVFGGLAYFLFFYQEGDFTQKKQESPEKIENQKILEEAGIHNVSYTNAIKETYQSL